MPLIQVKLIEEVFTPAQKRQIITNLTDAMVGIEGESLRPYTCVTVEEVRSGDGGIGGKTLTTSDVRAAPSGKTRGRRPMPTLVLAPCTESLKSRLRSTWMAGDYDRFSRFMECDTLYFYERLDVPPGAHLLDVACGSGQLALICGS